jgi:hypothetical protein
MPSSAAFMGRQFLVRKNGGLKSPPRPFQLGPIRVYSGRSSRLLCPVSENIGKRELLKTPNSALCSFDQMLMATSENLVFKKTKP